MSNLRSFAGPLRAVVFFGILLAFTGAPNWMLTTGIFTLEYAAMASAWNLVGGFAGYPSLGHAAFFGIGAYFEAIWFQHDIWTVTSGYEPFLLVPLVGLVGAAVGYPFAVIAMRTRSDVFAIVTITLLFVFQVLATNLHSSHRRVLGHRPAPVAVPGGDLRAALLPGHGGRAGAGDGHHVGCHAFQDRSVARGGARRRGQGGRHRRAHERGQGPGLLRERRADRDGRGGGLELPVLHLPAVLLRSADHDRHRAR